MNLLALDTSSVACTVALQLGGNITERHVEQPREHTHLLMPMISEVLHASGVQLADLDAIVLGNGPGSFIGMRIAASVAQGLAHGAGLKIIPVSSLAAVAVAVFAESDARNVAVAQDAHMNEVYLGLFSRGGEDLPVAITDERLHPLGAIPEWDETRAANQVVAGFGWRRYPELMQANQHLFLEHAGIEYPRARFLLPLAARTVPVEPQKIAPAYLRQKVAERPPDASP